jgi:hypothetical protein
VPLGTSSGRLPGVVERIADGLLDVAVLAFAGWTVVYHACLVLRLGTGWAIAAGSVALGISAWLALRWRETNRSAPRADAVSHDRPRHRQGRNLVVVQACAAVLTASLVAFFSPPWTVTWLALVLAAAGSVALAFRRSGDEAAGSSAPAASASAVAVIWTFGLAAFSLFLVRPDADDTYHVRLSSWIAAHGRFPLRDFLFSDESFPAIIFPPTSSFEGLVGAASQATGISSPALTYLLVTPIASGLAVLALWRLLRIWSVSSVGLTLSISLTFLLFNTQGLFAPGNLFIGRLWQGKVVFAAVLVPILFVLLTKYLARPEGRMLVLLAAAGIAAVGLTSSAALVVPVLAAGCVLPIARRQPRRAAAAYAATTAYSFGTLLVTAALGSRRAAVYDVDVFAPRLLDFVVGEGVVAFILVLALLFAPPSIPRTLAARMTATTVLLVACLLSPLVVGLFFHTSGVGQVLWRWTWAVPTAALVGVLATQALRTRTAPGKAIVAVGLLAAVVAAGTPLWSKAGALVADEPTWKRYPRDVRTAHRVLAAAEPEDVILAPDQISQTVLLASGTVTTVAPRRFYAAALRDIPEAHAPERLLLHRFVNHGLRARAGSHEAPLDTPEVIRALRVVGVDIACLSARDPERRTVLLAAGFSQLFAREGVTCLEARTGLVAGGR